MPYSGYGIVGERFENWVILYVRSDDGYMLL